MVAMPAEEGLFERPKLNKTLEPLVDGSVPLGSGPPDFDGEMTSVVVGALSCRSEDCDVTQYITSAFTMT